MKQGGSGAGEEKARRLCVVLCCLFYLGGRSVHPSVRPWPCIKKKGWAEVLKTTLTQKDLSSGSGQTEVRFYSPLQMLLNTTRRMVEV